MVIRRACHSSLLYQAAWLFKASLSPPFTQYRIPFHPKQSPLTNTFLSRLVICTAMSASTQAPFRAQDPEEISQLVKNLTNNQSKTNGTKGFKAKKTSYDVKGSSDNITVDSWRFHDWDYKRRDLPTYARGLFTTKNRRREHEIAARGYDKFFNTDEVHETMWDNINAKTQGPYELTLKENGCIIFISGLEDETLLVCSKHSTGDRSDVEVSHASAGERWVDKQLATLGKTREELARDLRKRNATAVAELCDDEFEEHILAYGPEKAGLYLHGININVPEFMTYPSESVQQFANEWGFRTVGLQKFEDISAVKTFLESVAETGAHEGRDVEGFVVRCKMSEKPGQLPFMDWFFKYKFDEPYLMYRQWRECTKSLISGKPPKFKKHKKITEEYLQFARKRLLSDPQLSKLYNKNHGIIGLRNEFLEFKHMKGSEAANVEIHDGDEPSDAVDRDVVLVPIATLGCGKTTIAVALSHLFDWGLVQNDNIQGKARPAQMVSQVMAQLMEYPVVVSDRNNSERREREQIIKDCKNAHMNVRLVALNFVHGDMEEVRRVTRERVLKRGNNHQTIQAATEEQKVLGIMENFIHRFQPCDPERMPDVGFDSIIDLDASKDSRANLETVIRELHKTYPGLVKELPSAEDMDKAVQAAIENYTPALKHVIPDRKDKRKQEKQQQQQQQQPKKPKERKLEYMSVSVPAKDITVALENAFRTATREEARFYKQLQQTRRVQNLFHVTLMHRATQKDNPELWQHYTALHAKAEAADATEAGKVGECDVILERVVYDDRIMAIAVRLLDEDGRWKCTNKVAHITIGTRDDSVKPKESNDLLAQWLAEGTGGDSNKIGERVFENKPIVKGTVRGVLSR